MRVEPYTTGSIIHVVKRGSRGMDIVLDDKDKWQFAKSLFLLNDVYISNNWHRETLNLPTFKRPRYWPERRPLVRILAWVLMPNHFHLLLEERVEGGISKFMQRLCGSMTLCFNLKYKGKGSIFQGAYKAKIVDEDSYLRHLSFYIQIKNVLELYPGGIFEALNDFDSAWEWALKYPFSSLPEYVQGSNSPILGDHNELFSNIGKSVLAKNEALETLKVYMELKSEAWAGDRLQSLVLEE